ncbi:MAG: hypothetical protein HKO13_09805 [Sphingomonas sp.]|nr:hypothetical protein [Sphingomonas sp.]RZV52895.1 MAG: hypothetical protein EX258_01395 [Sphingomonadaceae bacterium]
MKLALLAPIAAAMITAPTIADAQDRRVQGEEILRQMFGGQAQSGWQIGPILRGRSYSPGMPATAQPYGSGFVIDFPTRRDHHVHYVTKPVRSLAGARAITVRYRIDAARGARFVPQARPDQAATMSLYFQRGGDNWSGSSRYKYYRWYAPTAKMKTLRPGEYEMTIRMDDPDWIAVSGGTKAGTVPREFAAALANASRVGIVFGSSSLRGHGVYATAPARITVTDFNIR